MQKITLQDGTKVYIDRENDGAAFTVLSVGLIAIGFILI